MKGTSKVSFTVLRTRLLILGPSGSFPGSVRFAKVFLKLGRPFQGFVALYEAPFQGPLGTVFGSRVPGVGSGCRYPSLTFCTRRYGHGGLPFRIWDFRAAGQELGV